LQNTQDCFAILATMQKQVSRLRVGSQVGDNIMRLVSVAAALATFTLATSALAQTPNPMVPTASRVTVVVDITTPRGLTRPMIEAGMERSKPTYQAIPGLIRKYFTIGDDGHFGGIYLWTDRAAAQAWFNAAWRTRVVATYGSEPKITYYDAPIVLDGMAKAP
jgi:hypothetical protein